MKKIEPKVGTITGLSYFPDGKTLVVQSMVRDFVTLWNIDSGSSESIPFRDSVGSSIDCSALSADGRLLAVGGVSARVVIRDLKAKRQTAQLEALPKDVENLFNLHEVLSLAFSSDGKLLAASCGLKVPSTVTLWALEPVALKTVVCAPRGMSRETVWCVRFSPDATLLAYAGDALVLWDVNRARPFASWSDGRTDTWPPVPIYSVAFSPKGNLIASAHFDATVKLFSYANATATSK
jgi:WD40 repeat protein